MLIDAHHHLWDPAHGDYGWLTPDSPLFRRFAPADLAPLLRAAGVGGTVLVQAAPSAAETERLLAVAARTPWVLGVVGWADLSRPDQVQELMRRPSLVGLRPMLQDLPDRAWIIRPAQAPALRAMAAAGLVFDALVRHDQLHAVATLAEAHPELTIVLDHAGKPPLGDAAATREWREAIARLAEHPNVCCKLSGLLTELPSGASNALVLRCMETLLALWGPDRLLWGSDWPVLTTAGTYADWLEMVRLQLPASWADRVLGDNAARVYKLTDKEPAP